MKILYWPVACDLDRSDTGRIVVGHDTAESCNRAIGHAKDQCAPFIIAPCAGRVKDPQWNSVVMSKIMGDYIFQQGIHSDNIQELTATTFDTRGEAKAIVRYLENHSDIHVVVICVKWWHALRCWKLLDNYLRLSAVITWPLKIRVETCESAHACNVAIRREFWLATPLNMIKILWSQFFLVPRTWIRWKRYITKRKHVKEFDETG